MTPSKLNSEHKGPEENGKELSRKELQKQLKGDKDPSENRSKEERVKPISLLGLILFFMLIFY